MVGVQENNAGGPGKQWLGPAVRRGGIGVDRGEAASERSMGRARGRERLIWRESGVDGVPDRDGEGGDRERERERERTIAKKRGMGKG